MNGVYRGGSYISGQAMYMRIGYRVGAYSRGRVAEHIGFRVCDKCSTWNNGVSRGAQYGNYVERYRSGSRWVSSARSYVHGGIGFR